MLALQRQADGQADVDGVVAEAERRLQLGQQPDGRAMGRLGVLGQEGHAQHVGGQARQRPAGMQDVQSGADLAQKVGGQAKADRAPDMGEAVHAQGRDHQPALARPGHGRDHLLQRAAVGQVGFLVVHGQVGDLGLAGADLAGHGVEAGGQPADLVLGADGHLGALAPLQPVGGLFQRGDRPGDAARQGPAAGQQDQEAQDARSAGGLQQHPIGRQGQGHGIAQHQGRRRARAQGLQGGDQGDRRASHGRQPAGADIAAGQLQVDKSAEPRRIDPGPVAPRETPASRPHLIDHRRLQRDR